MMQHILDTLLVTLHCKTKKYINLHDKFVVSIDSIVILIYNICIYFSLPRLLLYVTYFYTKLIYPFWIIFNVR